MSNKNYVWDFSDYFSNENEFEKTFLEANNDIKKFKNYEGKLGKKAQLLELLKLLEKSYYNIDKLYVYAHCKSDMDVTNAQNQERLARVQKMATDHSVETAYIAPELTSMDNAYLENIYKDKAFSSFSSLIRDVLRNKPHTLNKDCEILLSSVGDFSDDFQKNMSSFGNGDLKYKDVLDKNGKPKKLTQALISSYLRSADSTLRLNTYKERMLAYGRFNNFLSSNYLASVKKDVFFARARHFDSALLGACYMEEVNSKVYDNLVKNVEKFLPLNQEYFKAKKKALAIKNFSLSDIYFNPFSSSKKYSFEDALNIVVEALSIFGEEYTSYIKKMASEGMIDVYERKGKVGGGYETMASKCTPRILLNFTGTANDVSTLAHELGHAMHSVYSDKNQSIINSSYTIFLAEIASTVNETILNEFMFNKSKSNSEKVFYLSEFLSNFNATVFRQTMFATFEQIIHKKVEDNEPVSSQVLNETYFSLVKKYFGKSLKILNEVKYEWSLIPHFYTPFYVYKYATGLVSAINIVENLKSGKISVDDYKKFLSSGCIKDPITLLKIVKVDLTTDEPFNVAFSYFETKLKAFKSLTSKK